MGGRLPTAVAFFSKASSTRALGREPEMTRLKSEIEVTCPCCQSTLVIDANLGRVVSHHEPERANKPELNDAQRIIAAEAARREAMFQQSVNAEKTRDDALSRRFEEALKQANKEPITKPTRDFDLD
jgi:hypothetical protein